MRSGGRVTWQSTALDIRGEWRSDATPVRETVYEGAGGAISWECMLPKAQCDLQLGGGARVQGLGYVECLRMTIAPWSLPIDTLRWGRFLSPSAALVWIDWAGSFSNRILYLNGERIAATGIDDSRIALEDGSTVEFDRGAVMRQGPLGSTALSIIPGIRKIAPARMLMATEQKWLSRATFRRAGQPCESGWAIHEVVQWP